jgi:cobalt-zinc-cadmium efflux system protein
MPKNTNRPPPPRDRHHYTKVLWWVFGINLAYLIIEATGGILTGSMALLSDAGHMFTDAGAIGLALFAGMLAQKPKDPRRTYGYLRAEILGALINGILLILLCGYILMEAYQRLSHPRHLSGGPILFIAAIGLVVNLISAFFLHRDRSANLNLEGAYLHMIYDALGSIGAMAAGIIILLTGWTPVDTIASILIAVLILKGAWRLLMKAIDILMEGTPPEIDYHELQETLKAREHIVDMHDLHIWTISSGVLALSAHIELSDECIQSGHWPHCLKDTQDFLREQWGIEHTTLQTEPTFFKEQYGKK